MWAVGIEPSSSGQGENVPIIEPSQQTKALISSMCWHCKGVAPLQPKWHETVGYLIDTSCLAMLQLRSLQSFKEHTYLSAFGIYFSLHILCSVECLTGSLLQCCIRNLVLWFDHYQLREFLAMVFIS